MRYFSAALTLSLALTFAGAGPAHAETWCAWYNPHTHKCGFTNFDQCHTSVFAAGGYCVRASEEAWPN